MDEKWLFNRVVTHPMQAYEWGEFRVKTGTKVIRRGVFKQGKLIDGFMLTIHKIPHFPFFIGYLPKGNVPNETMIAELIKIGEKQRCIFIQLEPNVVRANDSELKVNEKILELKLRPATHPLFTKYTFILDLTKSDDEILKNMHPKARYNIKVAKKHGVEVIMNNSKAAFDEYLRLMKETTMRQKFYAHTENYHKLMWETLGKENKSGRGGDSELNAYLLTAKYKGKTLTAWIVFSFRDTLYYPYGASSSENRDVMASNLMMWEAILFGKKLGLSKFDMWGAMGANPDKKDPWYGFHSFKQKYGPEHVEFVGSFDLVINPILYEVFRFIDKLRWMYLRFRKNN